MIFDEDRYSLGSPQEFDYVESDPYPGVNDKLKSGLKSWLMVLAIKSLVDLQ